MILDPIVALLSERLPICRFTAVVDNVRCRHRFYMCVGSRLDLVPSIGLATPLTFHLAGRLLLMSHVRAVFSKSGVVLILDCKSVPVRLIVSSRRCRSTSLRMEPRTQNTVQPSPRSGALVTLPLSVPCICSTDEPSHWCVLSRHRHCRRRWLVLARWMRCHSLWPPPPSASTRRMWQPPPSSAPLDSAVCSLFSHTSGCQPAGGASSTY